MVVSRIEIWAESDRKPSVSQIENPCESDRIRNSYESDRKTMNQIEMVVSQIEIWAEYDRFYLIQPCESDRKKKPLESDRNGLESDRKLD